LPQASKASSAETHACAFPFGFALLLSPHREKNIIKKILPGLTVVAFAFAGGASSGSALAQGIKRTPLQKIDFPEGYTTVTAIAEVPAGASGRHSHPGVETGYVLEGELELVIDGQPPLKLKAGESLSNSGRRHPRCQGWR
jgi:hypothetical protein